MEQGDGSFVPVFFRNERTVPLFHILNIFS